MKSVMQTVASIAGSVVVSILATWLLRRLVASADRGGEGGAAGGRSGVIVVMMPILAGNHWHIFPPSKGRGGFPRPGKRG